MRLPDNFAMWGNIGPLEITPLMQLIEVSAAIQLNPNDTTRRVFDRLVGTRIGVSMEINSDATDEYVAAGC